MFTHFRSFYVQGSISGGLFVTVISALSTVDGYTPLITAGTGLGFSIGTVEPYEGNTDSQFDVNTNATLSVTVRLFTPTRNAAITGLTSGISAGVAVYPISGGLISPVAPTGGLVAHFVTLQSVPSGPSQNGSILEIAQVF